MMATPQRSAASPHGAVPSHSFMPELAALEWTEEGELAAAPRCRMVQRLLEAESLAVNQVELIRVSQPWCSKDHKTPLPPRRSRGALSSGRPAPDHQRRDAPPSG